MHEYIVKIVGNSKMSVESVTVLVGGGSLGFGKEERPMELMYMNILMLLFVVKLLSGLCALTLEMQLNWE